MSSSHKIGMSNPIHGIEIEQIENTAIKHVDIVDYSNQEKLKLHKSDRKMSELLEKPVTDRQIDLQTGVPKFSRRHGSQWMRVKTKSIAKVDDRVETKFITETHKDCNHKRVMPMGGFCCCQ